MQVLSPLDWIIALPGITFEECLETTVDPDCIGSGSYQFPTLGTCNFHDAGSAPVVKCKNLSLPVLWAWLSSGGVSCDWVDMSNSLFTFLKRFLLPVR